MSWESTYPAERLVSYDPSWVARGAVLATPLRAALGPDWAVEHVGSTSVPGLSAKPVIDLALGQPPGHHLPEAARALRRLGWSDPVTVGDHQATFLLDGPLRRAIGHVFTHEQWPTAHVRLFAQWLRRHEADRDEYDQLKRRLVDSGAWGAGYTQRKAAFVLRVVNRARADRGLPPVDSL